MTKKSEKKQSEKEVYRLWWEFLKRSEKYKFYCDAVRKFMTDVHKKKSEKYLIKNVRFILSQVSQKENEVFRQRFFPMDEKYNYETLEYLEYMEHNWMTFGDIFVGLFDDWWKVQETKDFSLPMVVLNDPDAVKALPWFAKECKLLKKRRKKFPNPKEIIDIITESEYEYLFIAVPMVGSMTMETISKKIAVARAAWEKDHSSYYDFVFKRFIMPVGRVRFDELKRYLRVYDLKQQGLNIKEIINEVDPFKRCNDGDVQRVFRSDLQKAKKIIGNVESGCFPEKPPDL